jgi:hypothetical protein
MAMTRFTPHHDDLSTERGFQFCFRCDTCGEGQESRLQSFTAALVSDVLHTAGSLFGAILGHAEQGAHELQRHQAGGRAHDEAFAVALAEARASFHQCGVCHRWVCARACWNVASGLCTACAQRGD